MRCCSLLLALTLLLVASCRREKEPERAYDLAKSRLLMTTGEELLDDSGDAKILPAELLAKLDESPEGRQLASLMREQWAQRELVAEANRLLAEERYNDLGELLERAQREGLATSQLLELTGLPQALQALRLYCARRPYERAADLEQNLEFLRPWVRQLQTLSPAFQSFYQEQQEQLLVMRQQEAVAAEEHILQRLDWLLVNANQSAQAGDFLAQSAEEYPQLPILRYLTHAADGNWQPAEALLQTLASPAGFLGRASTRERLSLELAIALSWDSLDEESRRRLGTEWENSTTTTSLSGTFLRARCLKNAAFFESAIAAWQKQATPAELLNDAPAFLADYLEVQFPDGIQAVTGWSLAAPDFAGGLSRLLEAAK